LVSLLCSVFCYLVLFVATNRQLFTLLEQMKGSIQELKEQMTAQAALLQWVVTRFGGVEEATTSLPDGVALPCTSIDELHHLEVQIADNHIRTKLVSKRYNSTWLVSH